MSQSRFQVDSTESRDANDGTISVGRASHSLMPGTRSSTTENVNIGDNNAVVQNLFQNTQLQTTFRVLRRYLESIEDDFADEIQQAFDLPKLWQKFKSLDWKMQVGVVLGTMALVGLTGWLSWRALCYLYPKIVLFFSTDEGKAMMTNIGTILEGMRVLAVDFGVILCGAAESVGEQMTANPGMPVNEAQVDDDRLHSTTESLQQVASPSAQSSPEARQAVMQFVQAFLRWYTSSLINTVSN